MNVQRVARIRATFKDSDEATRKNIEALLATRDEEVYKILERPEYRDPGYRADIDAILFSESTESAVAKQILGLKDILYARKDGSNPTDGGVINIPIYFKYSPKQREAAKRDLEMLGKSRYAAVKKLAERVLEGMPGGKPAERPAIPKKGFFSGYFSDVIDEFRKNPVKTTIGYGAGAALMLLAAYLVYEVLS